MIDNRVHILHFQCQEQVQTCCLSPPPPSQGNIVSCLWSRARGGPGEGSRAVPAAQGWAAAGGADQGEPGVALNRRYSPDELRYLPLNTALYEPPLDPELPALDSDGDSDDAEEGRGEEKRRSKGASVRTSPLPPPPPSPPPSPSPSTFAGSVPRLWGPACVTVLSRRQDGCKRCPENAA